MSTYDYFPDDIPQPTPLGLVEMDDNIQRIKTDSGSVMTRKTQTHGTNLFIYRWKDLTEQERYQVEEFVSNHTNRMLLRWADPTVPERTFIVTLSGIRKSTPCLNIIGDRKFNTYTLEIAAFVHPQSVSGIPAQ